MTLQEDKHTDQIHTEISLPVLTLPLTELGDFAHDPGCMRGVYVDEVEPGTLIVVRTKRSCYRLMIADDHRATVMGGSVFPEPAEVRIVGSTLGGSIIKSGWIGVGMRLELSSGLTRITTSRVKFLSIERVPSATPAS
jgi:hypothetical protein